MTYRDLRNLSECMRALGFPRPLSVEAFRAPSPPLLQEAARWLARRLEPDAELAGGPLTPDQRVAFVRDASAFFLSRGNVRLNARRVYGADGWAARELLKVAALLHGAVAAPTAPAADAAPAYDLSSKLSEIKQARQLATEITAQGAFLYDLLDREPDNKVSRETALGRPLELSTMEAGLRRATEDVAARVAAARDHIEGVAASEAALDAKIERRRAELQRAEKRLHTVQKIKPAYQGELTALEAELEELWEQYVLRYRCVEALKHQLSLLEAAQAEAAEEQQAAILQLIHKYEAEDVLGALSDSEEGASSDERDASEAARSVRAARGARPVTRPGTRLRIKTAVGDDRDGAAGAGAESRRAFGSMATRTALDEPTQHSDSDSELSDGPFGGAGAEDVASRWRRTGHRPRPATRTLTAVQGDDDDDDDDFADLIDEGGSAGDSLGSSDETELQLAGAGAGTGAGATGARSAGASRAARAPTALSDNEF